MANTSKRSGGQGGKRAEKLGIGAGLADEVLMARNGDRRRLRERLGTWLCPTPAHRGRVVEATPRVQS